MASGLSQLLVQTGLVKPEEVRVASAYSSKTRAPLPFALVDLGFCKPRELAQALSRLLSMEVVGPDDFAGLGRKELSAITSEMAAEFRAVPMRVGASRILLALSDPTNRKALEDVSQFTGLTVIPVVASEADLGAALYYYYSVGGPPPETGPMAVSWKPSITNPAKTSIPVKPGQDDTALTPEPVAVGVKVKLGSHEPLDLDAVQNNTITHNAQMPITAPRAASPITDEVRAKYSSLDWWLGRTDDTEIVVRTPKGLAKQEPPADSLDLDMPLLLEPVEQPRRKTTQELVKPRSPDAVPKKSTLEFASPLRPWASDPMLEDLAESSSREKLSNTSLPYLLQDWARAAVFVVRHSMVLGLDASGEDLEAKVVKAMVIPLNAPSMFKHVMDTGKSYVGQPMASSIDNIFFKAMGKKPKILALLPLIIPDGRIVSFLYADSGESGKASPGDPKLEILRAAACRFLQNLLRAAKEGRL